MRLSFMKAIFTGLNCLAVWDFWPSHQMSWEHVEVFLNLVLFIMLFVPLIYLLDFLGHNALFLCNMLQLVARCLVLLLCYQIVHLPNSSLIIFSQILITLWLLLLRIEISPIQKHHNIGCYFPELYISKIICYFFEFLFIFTDDLVMLITALLGLNS